MDDKNLDALLDKVHAELQQVDHVDEDSRKRLQDLEQDIRDLLAQANEDGAESSVLQRMKQAIEDFEVTYPTLTAMLSEISKILNNAGI